ncbi:hypothetical protein M413DRAFT_362557 [Hebeloma cylindrosporum]|uniref:Uncharacterized protein n=1 Tax=Hebeloma cylindrosporum TaxID=76867 RepID=A0A0C3C7D8_HEBCY|nr:hypothetical protein M413DRAFT_362557 [Hebeloma cylindrosporum h7]
MILKAKLGKPITHPSIRVTSDSETPEQQAERLHLMFHQGFRGKAHQRFIDALGTTYTTLYDETKYFGRTIPVVQSSASGKSRMVYEMGKMVPTLSICFRRNNLPSSGWPPNDEPAYQFLLEARTGDAQYKGEEIAAAFLGALAHVVGSKIKARLDLDPLTKDWMGDWRLDSPTDIVNSSRYKCFIEVAVKAEELLRQNREEIIAWRFPSMIKGTSDSAPNWHIKLFKHLTRPYFDELALVVKKCSGTAGKYFVFAFDECSQLNVHRPCPKPGEPPARDPLWGMSLIALQRIIKAYDAFISDDIPFWFLLLDTNSSLANMAPVGRDATSRRLTKSLISLPPWPFVGFNQMVEADLAAHIKLPTDVLTMKHLKVYGRPYWSTLTDREVLGAAFKKLFSPEGFQPTNQNHVFAAFAIRAGLEIGQGEASERLDIQAVRSHMRILKSVVGSLVITASPSEPMLALAAAEGLNSSEETYQEAMHTLLDELILKGLVLDRCLLGEVWSRILLLRARDKASIATGSENKTNSRWSTLNWESGVPSVRALTLSNLLVTMLGENLGIPKRDAVKTCIVNKLLAESDEHWVNFSHFVYLSVSIDEVTPAMLREAWFSGYAFQCVFHQPVIDGFMVVYRGSLNEPFDESRLFVVPWQTKAKSEAAGPALAKSLTAPFIVAEDGSRRKPRHLVILFDLGSPSAFGTRNGSHCDVILGRPEPPVGKVKGGHWGGYARELEGEEEEERYVINICGHRAKNYPVLRGLETQFDQLFERSLGYMEPGLAKYGKEMEASMDRITFV